MEDIRKADSSNQIRAENIARKHRGALDDDDIEDDAGGDADVEENKEDDTSIVMEDS